MGYERLETLKESEKSKVYLILDNESQVVLVEKRLSGEQHLYERLQCLRHPYLPRIYEVQFREGMTFIYEEYIAGGSLERVSTGERQCVQWMLELCEVLSFLHQNGILHRDIKPANLLLGTDGHIRLIDFDAAREEKLAAQSDTHLLGTQGYAPPEQYGFAQTDARADIYAAGITFKLLLGKKAKKREYQRVIQKCTQFAPEQRYSSARQLAAALRRRKLRAFAPLVLSFLSLFFIMGSVWYFISQPTAEVQPSALPAAASPSLNETPVGVLDESEVQNETPDFLAQLTGEWVATNRTPLNGFPEFDYTNTEIETYPFTGFALDIIQTEQKGYYGTIFYLSENAGGEYLYLNNDQALAPQVVSSSTVRFFFDGQGSTRQVSAFPGYLELSVNAAGNPMATLVLDGEAVGAQMPIIPMDSWLNGKYKDYDSENSSSLMLNSTDTFHPLEVEDAFLELCAGRWTTDSDDVPGIVDLYQDNICIVEAFVSHYRTPSFEFSFYFSYEPGVQHNLLVESWRIYLGGEKKITIDGIPYELMY